MVAAVFLMQPIGQALAQVLNVAVILVRDNSHNLQAMRCGLDTKYEYECRQSIDGIWRIVIGVGAVPALLAILFRFMLPDSGMYNLEVRRKSELVMRNVAKVYGGSGLQVDARSIPLDPVPNEPEPDMPIQFSRRDMYRYFIKDRNWLYLLGTSGTWFILDVALCGFGLDNRVVLADMWATKRKVPNWADTLPVWQTDYTEPCNTIYDVLLTQAKHYLLTVSIGSILGCAAFIFMAKYFPRRQFLTASFVSLAILFSATGGVYYAVHHGPRAISTAVMVGICHFAFNFGANSLTFLIPAEIFPTTYRCFCHGISAAAGKLGSIVAVFMVYSINNKYEAIMKQGLVFLLFAGIGAVGAIFSWAYLPDIQRRGSDGQLANPTLEELGEGLRRAEAEGQVFTVREKWALFQFRWKGPQV
ncbi:hypothetical protein QQZ08_005245 [Neonectria magnoliae]|uniref:Major facilitator superfamily (MFS) profile domain-containing protein n=1 Tax=Neonectria magnoliae TaxID=2732573 RepID=A0ABR1I576_9HYPO